MKNYEREFFLSNDTILSSLISNDFRNGQNIARKLFDDNAKQYEKIARYRKAREEDKKQQQRKKEEQIEVKIDTKQIEKELEKLFSL